MRVMLYLWYCFKTSDFQIYFLYFKTILTIFPVKSIFYQELMWWFCEWNFCCSNIPPFMTCTWYVQVWHLMLLLCNQTQSGINPCNLDIISAPLDDMVYVCCQFVKQNRVALSMNATCTWIILDCISSDCVTSISPQIRSKSTYIFFCI